MSDQIKNSLSVGRQEKSKGFSLVEMLIVVFIFTLVMGIAMGVFATAIRLQKYNLAYQQLLSQASYAMEYMDRSIRMAVKNPNFTTYNCSFDSYNKNYYRPFSNYLRFVNYRGQCQTFYLSGGQVRSLNPAISASPLPLTSNDFIITRLYFNIIGDSAGSQPKVTIVMEIKARTTVLPNPKIKIQTTVSQRNLNI